MNPLHPEKKDKSASCLHDGAERGPGTGIFTLPKVPKQCSYFSQAGHFCMHSWDGGHLSVKGDGWCVQRLPWLWGRFLCPISGCFVRPFT